LKKTFIIYKATNNQNNKSYIGLTTRSLHQRKLEHLQHARANKRQYSIYHAIRKYGENSFTWEVINQTTDKNKLQELEKYYIKKYNTFYDGYNQTKGGEGGELPLEIRQLIGEKNSIAVTQIHPDTLEVINQFIGATKAGNELNISSDDITKACTNKTVLAGGYRWCKTSQLQQYLANPPKKPIYHNKKAVVQLDQDTLEVINTFRSLIEAEETTHISFKDISSVCNNVNITTGGYRWCFKVNLKNYLKNPPDGQKIRKKTIYMLDKDTYKILGQYNGTTDAVNKTGLKRSSISHALGKRVIISQGYRWCYKTEYETYIKKAPQRTAPKKVRQLNSETKEIISEFSSLKDASQKTGISYASIKDTCGGRQKTGGGYIWEYIS